MRPVNFAGRARQANVGPFPEPLLPPGGRVRAEAFLRARRGGGNGQGRRKRATQQGSTTGQEIGEGRREKRTGQPTGGEAERGEAGAISGRDAKKGDGGTTSGGRAERGENGAKER